MRFSNQQTKMDAFSRRIDEDDDADVEIINYVIKSNDDDNDTYNDDIANAFLSEDDENRQRLLYAAKRPLYTAPEFVKRLTAFEEVEISGTVAFECQFVAFPRPAVKWYKDDQEVVASGRVWLDDRQETDGVLRLVIEDARLEDEGAYKCKAENQEGVASTTGYLSVTGESRDRSLASQSRRSPAPIRAISTPPHLRAILEQKTMEELEAIAAHNETSLAYGLPGYRGDAFFQHIEDEDIDLVLLDGKTSGHVTEYNDRDVTVPSGSRMARMYIRATLDNVVTVVPSTTSQSHVSTDEHAMSVANTVSSSRDADGMIQREENPQNEDQQPVVEIKTSLMALDNNSVIAAEVVLPPDVTQDMTLFTIGPNPVDYEQQNEPVNGEANEADKNLSATLADSVFSASSLVSDISDENKDVTTQLEIQVCDEESTMQLNQILDEHHNKRRDVTGEENLQSEMIKESVPGESSSDSTQAIDYIHITECVDNNLIVSAAVSDAPEVLQQEASDGDTVSVTDMTPSSFRCDVSTPVSVEHSNNVNLNLHNDVRTVEHLACKLMEIILAETYEVLRGAIERDVTVSVKDVDVEQAKYDDLPEVEIMAQQTHLDISIVDTEVYETEQCIESDFDQSKAGTGSIRHDDEEGDTRNRLENVDVASSSNVEYKTQTHSDRGFEVSEVVTEEGMYEVASLYSIAQTALLHLIDVKLSRDERQSRSPSADNHVFDVATSSGVHTALPQSERGVTKCTEQNTDELLQINITDRSVALDLTNPADTNIAAIPEVLSKESIVLSDSEIPAVSDSATAVSAVADAQDIGGGDVYIDELSEHVTDLNAARNVDSQHINSSNNETSATPDFSNLIIVEENEKQTTVSGLEEERDMPSTSMDTAVQPKVKPNKTSKRVQFCDYTTDMEEPWSQASDITNAVINEGFTYINQGQSIDHQDLVSRVQNGEVADVSYRRITDADVSNIPEMLEETDKDFQVDDSPVVVEPSVGERRDDVCCQKGSADFLFQSSVLFYIILALGLAALASATEMRPELLILVVAAISFISFPLISLLTTSAREIEMFEDE